MHDFPFVVQDARAFNAYGYVFRHGLLIGRVEFVIVPTADPCALEQCQQPCKPHALVGHAHQVIARKPRNLIDPRTAPRFAPKVDSTVSAAQRAAEGGHIGAPVKLPEIQQCMGNPWKLLQQISADEVDDDVRRVFAILFGTMTQRARIKRVAVVR